MVGTWAIGQQDTKIDFRIQAWTLFTTLGRWILCCMVMLPILLLKALVLSAKLSVVHLPVLIFLFHYFTTSARDFATVMFTNAAWVHCTNATFPLAHVATLSKYILLQCDKNCDMILCLLCWLRVQHNTFVCMTLVWVHDTCLCIRHIFVCMTHASVTRLVHEIFVWRCFFSGATYQISCSWRQRHRKYSCSVAKPLPLSKFVL